MSTRRGVTRLIDQGTFSLGNVVTLALVTRGSPRDLAGAVIVLLVAYPVATAIVQGYVVDALVVAGPTSAPEQPVLAARAWYGGLRCGFALCWSPLLLLAINGGRGATAAVMLALGLPLLCAQFAGRAYCLAAGRLGPAIASDVAWLGGQLVVYAAARANGLDAADASVFGWASAGAIAGAVFALGRTGGRRAAQGPAGVSRRTRLQFAGELLVGQGAAQLIVVLVGTFIGLGPVAGYRIAQAVLGPLMTGVAAVRHVLLPRYVEANRRPNGARAVVALAASHGAVVALLFQTVAMVLWLLPPELLNHVFGPAWLDARHLVLIVGLDLAAATAGMILALGLRARLLARTGLLIRLAIACIQVSAVSLACILLGTVRAAAWAGAAASVIGITLYIVGLARARRGPDIRASESGTQPATPTSAAPAAPGLAPR